MFNLVWLFYKVLFFSIKVFWIFDDQNGLIDVPYKIERLHVFVFSFAIGALHTYSGSESLPLQVILCNGCTGL